MSKNKIARKKLEKLYGKECFIEKLHLRVDTEPRKYTSKGQMQRMKQLSYHHIKERYKGGKSTVANGAILSVENHAWFHRQPAQIQRKLNKLFQDYKRNADELSVEFVDDINVPFTIAPIVFYVDERGKYNRSKKKKEDLRLIREYEDSIYER